MTGGTLFGSTPGAKQRLRLSRIARIAAVRVDGAGLAMKTAAREGDFALVAAEGKRVARAASLMARCLRRLAEVQS